MSPTGSVEHAHSELRINAPRGHILASRWPLSSMERKPLANFSVEAPYSARVGEPSHSEDIPPGAHGLKREIAPTGAARRGSPRGRALSRFVPVRAGDLQVGSWRRKDPPLAQLAAAAVSGLAPAGPELRRRPALVAFDGRLGVVISAPLSVGEAGFSWHAATRAGAADEQGREARLKYDPWKSPTGDILRLPLSTERQLPGPAGLVRIARKKPE